MRKQLNGVPNHYIEFKGVCHDCSVPVKIICYINEAGSEVIEGGAVYNPVINGTQQLFFKCDKCFREDKTLRNWNPTEVYSRIVGFLRPVSGWNPDKQEEWKMRKEFVVGEEERRKSVV